MDKNKKNKSLTILTTFVISNYQTKFFSEIDKYLFFISISKVLPLLLLKVPFPNHCSSPPSPPHPFKAPHNVKSPLLPKTGFKVQSFQSLCKPPPRLLAPSNKLRF